MATVRNPAPAMMKAIMQVVVEAASRLSPIPFQLAAPVAQASSIAPVTPITAASVGDAIPA